MEIIATQDCEHDYKVMLSLDAHDIIQLHHAAHSHKDKQMDFWNDKGKPYKDPHPSGAEYRNQIFHQMVTAVQLAGAMDLLVMGALSWMDRDYDETEEEN